MPELIGFDPNQGLNAIKESGADIRQILMESSKAEQENLRKRKLEQSSQLLVEGLKPREVPGKPGEIYMPSILDPEIQKAALDFTQSGGNVNYLNILFDAAQQEQKNRVINLSPGGKAIIRRPGAPGDPANGVPEGFDVITNPSKSSENYNDAEINMKAAESIVAANMSGEKLPANYKEFSEYNKPGMVPLLAQTLSVRGKVDAALGKGEFFAAAEALLDRQGKGETSEEENALIGNRSTAQELAPILKAKYWEGINRSKAANKPTPKEKKITYFEKGADGKLHSKTVDESSVPNDALIVGKNLFFNKSEKDADGKTYNIFTTPEGDIWKVDVAKTPETKKAGGIVDLGALGGGKSASGKTKMSKQEWEAYKNQYVKDGYTEDELKKHLEKNNFEIEK